ncbi:hypothetical protein ACWELJ_21470 [Nocardia sp. NPDC004582]
MKRALLATSQFAVVLAALAVRLLAPGWWAAIVIMSFGLAAAVVLAPLLLAGLMAVALAPSLRPRTLITLAVADLAVMSFALTLPDFTDQADDHPVPLAAIATGDGNVSGSAATIFESISGWSAITYVVASLAAIILAALDYSGNTRTQRDRGHMPAMSRPNPWAVSTSMSGSTGERGAWR